MSNNSLVSPELLYNVLMEDYSKMIVNNLLCETLQPEHATALLYKILQMFNAEQQQEIVLYHNNITSTRLLH